MTDNTATERLREMLDERGVEWRSKDEELGLNIDGFHDTRWQVNGVLWCFIESGDNTCLAMCGEWKGCTPEQAIAATLGSGALTADNIRDLIERHSDHISGNTREFYNGAYAEIADELNTRADYHGYEQAAIEAWESIKAWNSRAERMCEPDGWHKCPACGCVVGYTELYGGGWSIVMDDYQIPYNNCPQCGRPILACD